MSVLINALTEDSHGLIAISINTLGSLAINDEFTATEPTLQMQETSISENHYWRFVYKPEVAFPEVRYAKTLVTEGNHLSTAPRTDINFI